MDIWFGEASIRRRKDGGCLEHFELEVFVSACIAHAACTMAFIARYIHGSFTHPLLTNSRKCLRMVRGVLLPALLTLRRPFLSKHESMKGFLVEHVKEWADDAVFCFPRIQGRAVGLLSNLFLVISRDHRLPDKTWGAKGRRSSLTANIGLQKS